MKDVMVDLETMSTDTEAVVLSIGAVYFDGEELGPKFYRVLDTEDQLRVGRQINKDTMNWWANQSEDAKKVFSEPTLPVLTVLDEFAEYLGLGGKDVVVWGNGATFDNMIIRSLYDSFRRAQPWPWYNDRCFRTLKNTNIASGSHELPKREGTHHNALDDAIYQAVLAQRYLKGTGVWASKK